MDMGRCDSVDSYLFTLLEERVEDSNDLPSADAGDECQNGPMGRSESMWSFQEFIKASSPACPSAGGQSILEYPCKRSDGVNIVLEPVENMSEVKDSQMFVPLKSDKNDGQMTSEVEDSQMFVSSKIDSKDDQASPARFKEPSLHPSEKLQDMSEQIKGQLTPLFTGLNDQSLAVSGSPIEAFLKTKLIQACEQARQRGTGQRALEARTPAPSDFLPTSGKSCVAGEQSTMGTKLITSGSSHEHSDDEYSDREDSKHMKRMKSNRESARRSRKRKQEQLENLEEQVKKLRAESGSLVVRLKHARQRNFEAKLCNCMLRSDVGTLRMKVELVRGLG